jgi:heterodisulfide reductase subunit C/nitrate reductase gamma subunit
MNINILLGLSGIICLVGLFFRLSIWFSQELRPPAVPITAVQRFFESIQSASRTVFSSKITLLIKSFFVDLLFQKRIFDKSYLRWIAHTLIFFGFIMLLLMHALDSVVTERFFSDYYSTLNPYLFLRNLFGVMVLAGLAIAVFRRVSLRPQRLKTNPADWTALIFIAVIIFSGMMLEGAKITSYTIYQNMVEEYGSFDEQEAEALEAYWVQENGLISPEVTKPQSSEHVAYGMEISSDSCMECHSPNSSAFASFAVRNMTQSISAAIGDDQAVNMFWYLHILACFSFLAWLPFSKMFHIIAAPVSLIIKGVMGDKNSQPATLLTQQMIGLSACTHCGTCSLECSSNMFFESFENDFILPSEKVQFLRDYTAGRVTDQTALKRLQQGLYVCTSCDRCTDVCPSGINLKEIFIAARYSLLNQGIPEVSMLSHFSFPLALAQNFVGDHLKALKTVTRLFKKSFKQLSEINLPMTLSKRQGIENNSFKSCFSCQRCTNICPVVRSFDNPVESLGLLPHQIMFSLGLGNTDLAMGSKMIWSCSTCYLCQEHCPNNVELCDIFYSLKNKAITKIEAGANS